MYSQDHKVFTRRGFKHFQVLRPEEEYLTYNVNSFTFDWVQAEDKIFYKFEGSIWHVYSQYIDLLVTANHKHFIRWEKELWRAFPIHKLKNKLFGIPFIDEKEYREGKNKIHFRSSCGLTFEEEQYSGDVFNLWVGEGNLLWIRRNGKNVLSGGFPDFDNF